MRLYAVSGLLAVVLTVPAIAAPDPKKPAPPDDSADIADKLTERIDFEKFDKVPLKSVLDVLQDKLGKHSILLDYKSLLAEQGLDGNPQALDERQLQMPDYRKVRIETVLRHVLEQIDAEFYIAPDHIRVTTRSAFLRIVGPIETLRDLHPRLEVIGQQGEDRPVVTVTAAFKDIPLHDALKQVAGRTGKSFVVSADAADKAKSPVTVNLANVPFDSAVSALAEAAGLRAYRDGAVAVIVTPERAKQVEARAAVTATASFNALVGPVCPGFGLDLDNGAARAGDLRILKDKIAELTAELEKLKAKK